MKVTYIYHSGFLVETENCYYIFDYYRGELPILDTWKPVVVFASHAHRDHYNPEIFEILQRKGIKQIHAVLAKDISKRKYPPEGIPAIRVRMDEEYELPAETKLRTLHSTDAGVAFVVSCKEGTIYHAGDLNDWVWEGEPDKENRQMTGSYRHEIQKLKNIEIDIAFVPLDPRQEDYYADGMSYFLRNVSAKKVYPMHYWEKPEIIEQFLEEYPEYREIIVNTENANQISGK